MGCFEPFPGRTKRGRIKSSGRRCVSRIILRNRSSFLNLLGLYLGNFIVPPFVRFPSFFTIFLRNCLSQTKRTTESSSGRIGPLVRDVRPLWASLGNHGLCPWGSINEEPAPSFVFAHNRVDPLRGFIRPALRQTGLKLQSFESLFYP